MTTQQRILVIGATGKVGRNVVAGLLAAGLDVRALVRTPAAAGLPPQVELVRGDLTDPAAVAQAAQGTDAAFLLWPTFDAAGAHEVVDALARHARHVVYLSAGSGDGGAMPGVWADVEAVVEAAGVDWTFLRAGGFAGNTLEWADAVRSGEGRVAMPYPAVGRSLIHERDLADVAVAALTEPGHAGRAYTLTGPQTLTQAEQVATIGEVLGIELTVEEQPAAAARDRMLALGADPAFVDASLAYWASLVDSPEAVLDGDVELVTGHPARTYREWVADHVDDFAPLSAAEVATRYVEAFHAGRWDASLALLAADVERVAPMETGGAAVPVRGLAAILDNSERVNADVEIHGVDVLGPMISGDRFAVRFTFDETHVPTGVRRTASKISLHTVRRSRITREEVYYLEPPA